MLPVRHRRKRFFAFAAPRLTYDKPVFRCSPPPGLTFAALGTIILEDFGHVDGGGTIVPLYEYHCPHCDIKFDLLRSFSQADAPAACPECQGEDTKRAISLFASFSRSSDGLTRSIAGSNGCAGCSASRCAQCKR